MKWLKRFLGRCVAMPCPRAYDQGHQDGFKEGYVEGQQWGHEHGACEHTHPFEDAIEGIGPDVIAGRRQHSAVSIDEYQAAREKQGVKFGVVDRRKPGFGPSHRPQRSTKGR